MEERGPSLTCVLDASMTLAWMLPGEQTPEVERVIDGVVNGGALVPSLWRLEVANVLRHVMRRGQLTLTQRDGIIAALRSWPITVDAETDSQAWSSTLRLADRHGLTVYDAAYLELADRSGLPLATLDGDLVKAVAKLGMRLA